MEKLSLAAQVVIAASVAAVWIFRFENIDKEFAEYRYSVLFRSFIGAAKIALSTLLVVGIWFPAPVLGAAVGMAALMAGAQWAHYSVRHPFPKYVPSLVLLLLSLLVAAIRSGVVA